MIVLIGLLVAVLQLHIQTAAAQELLLPNCSCPAFFAPVCGSDSITYANQCNLNCVSRYNVQNNGTAINMTRIGRCPRPDCGCQPISDNICATNGLTYASECFLSCTNDLRYQDNYPPYDIAYRGQCIWWSSSSNVSTGAVAASKCSSVIIPVCGTDSRSYRNYCYLKYESRQSRSRGLPPIHLKSQGACPYDNCICPYNYDPVCASNGVDYGNYCFFACQRRRNEQLGLPPLTVVNKGLCKIECKCNKIFDPVCGSDGRSYANRCLFDCENKKRRRQGLPPLKLICKGECGCFCPAIYDPVCGSDGKTYGNSCELGCENLSLELQDLPPIRQISKGECKPCKCPLNIDLICASNGKTYSNPCFLCCENDRRAKQGLPPLSYKKGPCPCSCPYIYSPVCATDGKTYPNSCVLNCTNEIRKQEHLPPLKIAYKGQCTYPCACPKNYNPLCGSDGRTYGNRCAFNCENRRRAAQGLRPLWIKARGPCRCKCNCPSTNQPVCGTDGLTYRNLCFLHCHSNCLRQSHWPAVFFKKNGSC